KRQVDACRRVSRVRQDQPMIGHSGARSKLKQTGLAFRVRYCRLDLRFEIGGAPGLPAIDALVKKANACFGERRVPNRCEQPSIASFRHLDFTAASSRISPTTPGLPVIIT